MATWRWGAAWKWGAAWLALIGGAAAAQAQDSAARERLRARERAQAEAQRALGRWTAQELTTFRNEADVRAYVRAVERAQEARYGALQARRVQFAQAQPGEQESDAQDPVCPPEDEDCLNREMSVGDAITVTGSAVSAPAPLTNVQEQGVDEGDIVKQIGHYLLILQDGRIFVVDMESGPGRDRLVLVDRADVYRHPNEEAWYDELVVQDDRVLVTGYSYHLGASEIAIFKLGADGRLTRDGVFQIKSADYYSRENYSTRVVDGRLVLYTPLPVRELSAEKIDWPRLRRVPIPGAAAQDEEDEDAAEAAFSAGSQLLTPQRLYRPLATLRDPTIHMITTCALGERPAGAPLGCESQGYVGSDNREFYVAGDQAYLWTYASETPWNWDYTVPAPCTPGYRSSRGEAAPAIVYRLDLVGRRAQVAGAAGIPFDQLGLDASRGRFRALVSWAGEKCTHQKGVPLAYLNTSEAAFGRRLRPLPASAYTAMPDIGANMVENRFTERHLVFGGRTQYSWWSDEPESDGLIGGGDAVVVPIDRPEDASTVRLPHRVWRAERVGDNVLLTGYSDRQGLDMSVIELRGTAPQLSSSLQLEGRFESEGRSHAFNSLIGPDGSGLMGLPTVVRVGDSDRYAWRSTASDLSFLALDAQGQLQPLGALEARSENGNRWGYENADDDDPGVYSCQVSCIDWYGNSRPLFTGGRIFGLTATELVEGRVRGARIGEVQRLDLTKTELPAHLRLPARPAAVAKDAGDKAAE
jgi:hypothetical protein